MTSALLLSLLPYILAILVLFFGYGALVRRGTLATGAQVLAVGAVVAVLAVGLWGWATYSTLSPTLRGNLPSVLLGPLVMAFCAGVCVWTAYRTQRVRILAEYTLGDTRLILMTCSAMRLPDAHALIVPTTTASAPMLGSAGGEILSQTSSADVRRALKSAAPLLVGKTVKTVAGRLAVGSIFWVALQEMGRNADLTNARKGIEKALEQAKQSNAESVAVVVTPMRGLTVAQATTATGEAIFKQRRAFAEVVLTVLDEREGKDVQTALETLLQKVAPDALRKPAVAANAPVAS